MIVYFICYCTLFIFSSLGAEKIMQVLFLQSVVVYLWSWCHTKLQTIKSAVCCVSTILSADFIRWLNHSDKSWPTLSIVCHLLNSWSCRWRLAAVDYWMLIDDDKTMQRLNCSLDFDHNSALEGVFQMWFFVPKTLPYLRGGQVVTPAQCWGRISSAQCATPM